MSVLCVTRYKEIPLPRVPQEVSLAILRGAVLFGLDPSVIQVRRSTMTYGVGVLNKFMRGIHPQGT